MIAKPTEGEHASYFAKYIALVPGDDALTVLKENAATVAALFNSLNDKQQNYRYAEGKWTPKEMLSHIVDTERGMCYRAMCVSRGDVQNLPYMDEDLFAKNSEANERSMQSLVDEYSSVRMATISLFGDAIPTSALSTIGTVNNHPTSARALAWIIAGHELNHCSVLKERYLKQL